MSKQITILKAHEEMEPNNSQIETDLGPMGIASYNIEQSKSYMDVNMCNHFTKILVTYKKALQQLVVDTLNNIKDDSANHPDIHDQATREEQFRVKLRTRNRERKLIVKIDKSLAKIESGDYGYCDACGIEIGIRRLEARPTATLCIDCKTIEEIKEKNK